MLFRFLLDRVEGRCCSGFRLINSDLVYNNMYSLCYGALVSNHQ